MNTARHSFWLFIFLISISFSGWYLTRPAKFNLMSEHLLAKTTDVVIHNLNVHQFNANGQLVNFLQSPLMRHTAEHNKYWFANPYIIVTQENEPNWEISSNEATSLYGGKEIHLNKNVVIHQPPSDISQESTITTESITYFPQKKIATTLATVNYKRPGHTIQSKGVKAYLTDQRVVLLKNAHGIFEPEKG